MFYVLRVYAEAASVPTGEPAIGLYRDRGSDGLELLASDDAGVSLADVDQVAIASILSHEPETESRKAWLRRAGLALYQRLAPGPVDQALRALTDSTVMLDLRSPKLALAPWELCRRDDTPSPLFADPEVWWLCGESGDSAARDERMVAAEWPLRMLVVVGSPPDDPAVRALDEVYALEDLARGERSGSSVLADLASNPTPGGAAPGAAGSRCDVLLYKLFQPDLDLIKRTLHEFKPHVFHFIGHGRIKDREPELRVFSRDAQVYHPWGYDQIGTAFHPRAIPRLVYLDACHSGFDAPDAWSLTSAFRAIGAGAVIAMQREITGSIAVDVAREFYSRLFLGMRVETAFAQVRRSLIAGNHDEWYVPRLWVRGDPARLCVASSPGRLGRTEASSHAPRAKDTCFVDRWPQRFHAWRDQDQAKVAGLLLVRGAPKTGKTAFASWFMEAQTLAGRSIVYVDFEGISGDYRTVLERVAGHIRGSEPGSDGFAGYRELVSTQDIRDSPERAGHYRERLLRLFWDGLRARTGSAPILLVLDHLRPDAFSDQVLAHEIAYLLCHAYRPPETVDSVHVLLVVTDEQARAVLDQPFEVAPPCIDLDRFDDFERAHYMPLYFRWRSRELSPQAADLTASESLQELIVARNMPCPEAFEAVEPLLLMMARNKKDT